MTGALQQKGGVLSVVANAATALILPNAPACQVQIITDGKKKAACHFHGVMVVFLFVRYTSSWLPRYR